MPRLVSTLARSLQPPALTRDGESGSVYKTHVAVQRSPRLLNPLCTEACSLVHERGPPIIQEMPPVGKDVL